MKQCLIAIHGVGTGSKWGFITKPPGIAVHLQRALSDEEISQLTPGWMDIPAVDELGPCMMVEIP